MLKLVAHLVTTIRSESSDVQLGPHGALFIQTVTCLTRRVQRRAKQEQGSLFIPNYPKNGCQENNSSRDEIYENSRIHLDSLQNKFTHCKGIRNNTGSRQTTGIQEELDITCKQNAS